MNVIKPRFDDSFSLHGCRLTGIEEMTRTLTLIFDEGINIKVNDRVQRTGPAKVIFIKAPETQCGIRYIDRGKCERVDVDAFAKAVKENSVDIMAEAYSRIFTHLEVLYYVGEEMKLVEIGIIQSDVEIHYSDDGSSKRLSRLY